MNINRIKKNIKKIEEIVENIDVQDVINRMEKDKENSIEEFEIKSVERIPHKLKQGILYVCLECQVAVHLCACGCGEKTVTPLGINGWALIFRDGELSLNPSIDNFNIPCKSHYFITNNKVRWC